MNKLLFCNVLSGIAVGQKLQKIHTRLPKIFPWKVLNGKKAFLRQRPTGTGWRDKASPGRLKNMTSSTTMLL